LRDHGFSVGEGEGRKFRLLSSAGQSDFLSQQAKAQFVAIEKGRERVAGCFRSEELKRAEVKQELSPVFDGKSRLQIADVAFL
jgi:hypothetical protein